MWPTLEPGDCVLVDPDAGIEAGCLVLVRDPGAPGRTLIKRVTSGGTSRFSVSSDDVLGGRDSRHFGPLGAEHLIGLVTLVFTRGGRFRLP